MTNRRTFIAVNAGAMLSLVADWPARAQPAPRRIGWLSPLSRADVESFLGLVRPELDKLGWSDGRNIVMDVRTPEGRNDLLPSVAAELVAQGPDLIIVQTLPATRALMQATRSIPIVMAGVAYPVEYGIVASFGRPGGNVTGSSYPTPESASKLMQLLKEAAPRLASVAFFLNPSNEAAASLTRQVVEDATALGMQAQIVPVSAKSDFEPAFAAIRRANSQSIMLPPEPLILANREAIGAFAQAHGLPVAIVGSRGALPPNGLMAFGPCRPAFAEITARYIDRILRGARPGDLAVEQPTRFDLVINLKTAKALGLPISQGLLLRASEVVE